MPYPGVHKYQATKLCTEQKVPMRFTFYSRIVGLQYGTCFMYTLQVPRI